MTRGRIATLLVVGVIVALAGLSQLIVDSGIAWLGVLMLLSAIPLFVVSMKAASDSKKH